MIRFNLQKDEVPTEEESDEYRAVLVTDRIPTPEEEARLQELEAQWLANPTFDPAEVPGFEGFRNRLTSFRIKQVVERREGRLRRLQEVAARIHNPGNLVLAEKWDEMEQALDNLGILAQEIEHRKQSAPMLPKGQI